MPDRSALVARLVEDGLLALEDGRPRTTPRWQGALARAALTLQRSGAPWTDLRLPIALALAGSHGDLGDAELADLVEVMAPIEEGLLPPFFGEAPGVAEG